MPTTEKPKRQPRGYHAQPNPKPFILPLNHDIASIVERYACGETPAVLAHELGISVDALLLRLKSYCLSGKADKAYADLVTEALIMRIALADERLDKAASVLDLGIAREQCRFSRMDFERRRPHLYGQRVEMNFTGPAAIFLGIGETAAPALPAPQPVVIEHQPDVIENSSDQGNQ